MCHARGQVTCRGTHSFQCAWLTGLWIQACQASSQLCEYFPSAWIPWTCQALNGRKTIPKSIKVSTKKLEYQNKKKKKKKMFLIRAHHLKWKNQVRNLKRFESQNLGASFQDSLLVMGLGFGVNHTWFKILPRYFPVLLLSDCSINDCFFIPQ